MTFMKSETFTNWKTFFLQIHKRLRIWKFPKQNRALILDYLDSQSAIFYMGPSSAGGKLGSKLDQKLKLCLCKNSSFPKYLYLYNNENYRWSEFQLNLMLSTGVIAPKPAKMGVFGS